MTRIVTEFPRRVREIENLWIPMSDGTRLAARVWMPEDAEEDPVPAILEYIPYRKRDGTAVRDQLTHPYFAGHGYACIRLDMRGNGDSEGLMHDEYTEQEQADAVDAIAWIADQAWCSGTVGMMGISWGGFNGLQVAALRPPALKAVITLCSTDDRYADDIHYKGGCLLNENLGWAATMLSYSSRPPDPALVGDRWRDMWLERLENNPLLVRTWLDHQHRDAYWRHGSVCEDFSAIEAAVLAVGGWNDAYSNAVPRLVNGLATPARAIIGPWAHKYPHFAVPEPKMGFLQEALRWWDRWLKGENTGVEDDPLCRVFVMESVPPAASYDTRPGRWIAQNGWPGDNIAARRLHLNAGSPGAGRLETEAAEEDALEVSSIQDTGLDGGEFCIIWLGPEFPGDQNRDDENSAIFQTEPLDEDVMIVGAPSVILELSVDRPVANIAVRLNDVHPDGQATRIAYQTLNLCHRDSHERPEPLVPGERYRVRVQLDDIGYTIPAGHRLRLSVSTAYWPLIWPAPEPVTLTLFSGGSTLDLPVCRDPGEAPDMPPAESAPPLDLETLREPSNSRVVDADDDTGATTLEIVDDFGEYRDPTHGLVSGEIGREFYSILPGDPLSARARTHWTQTLSRDDGWSVRTETFQEQWADAENFHITARMEAYEGDELVYEKDWSETVKRNLV